MRLTRLVAASATSLILIAGGASAASAATTTTSTTTKPTAESTETTKTDAVHHLEWRVTSGTFKTKPAAERRIANLDAKGATGFTALHRNHRWEAERTFAKKASAEAEARTVRKDGFRARVTAISVR